MTPTAVEPSTSWRCAEQCRQLDATPAGSAPSYAGLLLVELPLPWPSDVSDDPRLATICSAASAAGHRVQAIVPARPHAREAASVIRYTAPTGAFERFVRLEAEVDGDDPTDAALGLLSQPVPRDITAAEVVDVLICGHGKRDVCCGSTGVPLARQVATTSASGVRVWRTSHLGGHRYAPTALTLPDGRAWAWLDADALSGIVTRSAPAEVAARYDRGCGHFTDPWQQAAESAVFAREGWRWLESRRTATTEPPTSDLTVSRHVGIHAERPDGSLVGYRVLVELTRHVPVPVCGRPLDEAAKTSPELSVVEIDVADTHDD